MTSDDRWTSEDTVAALVKEAREAAEGFPTTRERVIELSMEVADLMAELATAQISYRWLDDFNRTYEYLVDDLLGGVRVNISEQTGDNDITHRTYWISPDPAKRPSDAQLAYFLSEAENIFKLILSA